MQSEELVLIDGKIDDDKKNSYMYSKNFTRVRINIFWSELAVSDGGCAQRELEKAKYRISLSKAEGVVQSFLFRECRYEFCYFKFCRISRAVSLALLRNYKKCHIDYLFQLASISYIVYTYALPTCLPIAQTPDQSILPSHQ